MNGTSRKSLMQAAGDAGTRPDRGQWSSHAPPTPRGRAGAAGGRATVQNRLQAWSARRGLAAPPEDVPVFSSSLTHPQLRVLELLLHVFEVLLHDGDTVSVLLKNTVRALQLLLQTLRRQNKNGT